MKILCVDDKTDNLYMIKSLLQPLGHQCVEAFNGEEALALLKKVHIDLIISDILMPVMDGFSLCRTIRKDEQFHNIPFIIFTATYTGEQDEELARKIGADDFIVKPCEPDIFVKRVQKALDEFKFQETKISRDIEEDSIVLKLYNERLVRKLEQKMEEMEQEVQVRKKAILDLQRSEDILKATQALGKLGGWEYNLETNSMYWTDEMYRLHDIDPGSPGCEDLAATSIKGFPEDVQNSLLKCMSNIKENGESYEIESWYTTLKGRKIYVKAAAIAEKTDDKLIKVVGTFQDLTEVKQAEMAKHDLEEQLRQAQKMDSIGQLAGGVAHDFNNVLTVILGYAEEIMNNLHSNDPLREDINEILNAGLRASSLTRQLLTFSRKQVIKPQLMNINSCITNLHKMLIRLIGEDVEFELNLADKLPYIMADIGQIEQVIMNLVINAREAMQMGGKLTITTFDHRTSPDFQSRHPLINKDHYVVLKVADTGCGMDDDTKSHIFEPFFTTKGQGKGHGTGLGLPTVYGIVRQAEGHIHVDTAPGKGANFVIMFPASVELPDTDQGTQSAPLAQGNSEEVIIVEDDTAILNLTGKIIGKMGFKVLLADSADQAMEMIEDEGMRPRLLIADVVMPGLSGVELATIIRIKHPEIGIILMSGYTGNVIARYGDLDPTIPFIQKPFSRRDMAEVIQKVIADTAELQPQS